MRVVVVFAIILYLIIAYKLFMHNKLNDDDDSENTKTPLEANENTEDNKDTEEKNKSSSQIIQKNNEQVCAGKEMSQKSKQCFNVENEKEFTDASKENLKDIQIAIAESDNFEAQKLLLKSPNLCAEALVILCEKSYRFNFKNREVQNWFEVAINRTKLTSKQEIRISESSDFVLKLALIQKEDLTARGLIELCENPGRLNLENKTVMLLYLDAINRTKPSEKDQLRMIKSQNIALLIALLISVELKPEALVAISESPGRINLESAYILKSFQEAVRRCELTSKQQIRMIKSYNFAAKLAMLLNPNIKYDAFLILCQNTQSFNMKNATVQKWFKEATCRLLPNINNEQKIKLAKTNIEGVITALI